MSERVDLLDGRVTLYRGDCREIMPTLGKVDAVVTDPPYGISDAAFDGADRKGKRVGKSNNWHAESSWDHAIDPTWIQECCNHSDLVAWFGHWRKREEVERAAKYPLRAEIVWAKDCHVGPPCPVAMRDERIWLFSKSGIVGKTFETSVWDYPIIPTWSRKHHKNEKPVGLMARLIRFLGAETVLDPFMGSGTTGVAAIKLGLKFVGVEQDQLHFETACKRIVQAANQPDLFVQSTPKPEQVALI